MHLAQVHHELIIYSSKPEEHKSGPNHINAYPESHKAQEETVQSH